MTYLILLNRVFPYKTGEAFLENEIEIVSKHFDKVLIYPIDISKNEKPTREIKSENVEVRLTNTNSIKSRKISNVLTSPKYFFKSKETNLGKKFLDAYFLKTSISQGKKIINDLDSFSIKENDTIYIYSYWLYTTAKIATIIKDYFNKKNISVKVLSRAHNFDIYEEKRPFEFLPQRNELLASIDNVYACSLDGANYIRTKYPNYAPKIKVSYLGTYDHGLGKCSDRKTLKIVSCSRLSKVKRVHLIAEALKLLKASGLSIEWTHLGGGQLFDELKQVTKDLTWMKVNLPGHMKNSEVYKFYNENPVDLFINVSEIEGLPVSIMEAISFGIPTIATKVGGTGEIVLPNVSGDVLSADFKVSDLAELIKKYAIMKEDSYQNLRKTTRQLWEKQYNAKINYENFVNEIL